MNKGRVDKIEAIDLEIGQVVWVNEEHGYCSVVCIGFSYHSSSIITTLQHTDLCKPQALFTKAFKIKNRLQLM